MDWLSGMSCINLQKFLEAFSMTMQAGLICKALCRGDGPYVARGSLMPICPIGSRDKHGGNAIVHIRERATISLLLKEGYN